jgi:dTDP-4-dehydrorhamnose reductase
MEDEIARLAPTRVVNAAARASIAACEAEPEAAREVNGRLPGALARAAANHGARIVHLSTDQVFDGASGLYSEDDATSPLHVYGHTKADGERRVLEACEDAVVLRLNLVYGRSAGPRASSSERMLARAREGHEILLFVDEHRSPVSVVDAVSAVRELLSSPFTGILHLGGPERLNRYELGRALLERAGMEGLARKALSAEYRGPPRAPDTSFDTSLSRRVLATPPFALADRLDTAT